MRSLSLGILSLSILSSEMAIQCICILEGFFFFIKGLIFIGIDIYKVCFMSLDPYMYMTVLVL